MWWNKAKKQEVNEPTIEDISELEQKLEAVVRPQPMSFEGAVTKGAEIFAKFDKFIHDFETATGEDAIIIAKENDECEGYVPMYNRGFLKRIEDQEDKLTKVQLQLGLANFRVFKFSLSDQFNSDWHQNLLALEGKLNSEDVLRDKASILAHFVIINSDIAIELYENHSRDEVFKETFKDLKMTGELEAKLALEDIAIWIRILSEICPKCVIASWCRGLSKENMRSCIEETKKLADWFMDYFYGEVSFKLAVQGFASGGILSAIDRASSYHAFREWVPKGEDKSLRGTLLWEAGKNIMELFGNKKVFSYNLEYSGLLMRRMKLACFAEFMLGEGRNGLS